MSSAERRERDDVAAQARRGRSRSWSQAITRRVSSTSGWRAHGRTARPPVTANRSRPARSSPRSPGGPLGGAAEHLGQRGPCTGSAGGPPARRGGSRTSRSLPDQVLQLAVRLPGGAGRDQRLLHQAQVARAAPRRPARPGRPLPAGGGDPRGHDQQPLPVRLVRGALATSASSSGVRRRPLPEAVAQPGGRRCRLLVER